jgi:hypothetical protein
MWRDQKIKIAGQYAASHPIDDLILFSKFMHKNNLIDSHAVWDFLLKDIMIAAPTVGVFSIHTFKSIMAKIASAAQFINSSIFIQRLDYQQRSAAFLLERLFSFFLIEHISSKQIDGKYGYHTVIADHSKIGASDL